MKDTLAVMAVPVIVVIILIIAGWFMYKTFINQPCEYYGNVAIKDTPSRCVQYFNNKPTQKDKEDK